RGPCTRHQAQAVPSNVPSVQVTTVSTTVTASPSRKMGQAASTLEKSSMTFPLFRTLPGVGDERRRRHDIEQPADRNCPVQRPQLRKQACGGRLAKDGSGAVQELAGQLFAGQGVGRTADSLVAAALENCSIAK